MAKSANAYVKIIVSSNIKQAMSDFKAAHPTLSKFGGMIKKVGLIGAAAFAAIVAGIYIMKKALTACLREYEEYMLGLVKVQRFTGMTAKATSMLVGQLRLSGVAVDKGTTGLRFFAKNLDAAREGQAAMVTAFERLGVALKDSDGNLRSVDDVLFDVRDRFSEIEDPAKRTALAVKLFGKGGADMLPWLTKSVEKMGEFKQFLIDTGLIMSKQAMKEFGDYRENQRKLSLAWDAIKVSAAAALVPLINELLPPLIRLIKRAAGWMGDFRVLVEKKGWGQAFEEMVPGGEVVRELLRSLRDWWRRNKTQIAETATQVGNVLKKLAELADWVGENYTPISQNFRVMFNFTSYYVMLSNILSKLQEIAAWIDGHSTLKTFLFGGDIPVPKDAEGGIVTRPRLSITGEAGPEAIVPLTNPSRAAEILSAAGLTGDTIVNVFLDGKLIEKQVTKRQSERLRRLERAYA